MASTNSAAPPFGTLFDTEDTRSVKRLTEQGRYRDTMSMLNPLSFVSSFAYKYSVIRACSTSIVTLLVVLRLVIRRLIAKLQSPLGDAIIRARSVSPQLTITE